MRFLAGTEDGLHHPGGAVLSGHRISALAGESGTWWVIADGGRIWKGSGVDWTPVAELSEGEARCLLSTPAGLLVGTSGARLLRLAGRELEPVAGFDRAEGRDDWYTPWGGPPDTRSLSRGPDGALYANVHVGGILRSRDGGASWEPTIDIDADVHQVLVHPSRPGLVLAASAGGLALSDDRGDSWRVRVEGLHHRYSRAVAVADGVVLVTASSGPSGSRAAIYRGDLDGTGPLRRCTDGLPEWFEGNIDTHCLVAERGVVAFGTADGSVYRSRDAGAGWERVAAGLPPLECLALVP